MKKLLIGCSIFIFCIVQGLQARQYEVPPSSSTMGSVPTISDEAMERCVELYNEIKWLNEDIANQVVDSYSQNSINSYNAKIDKHNRMQDSFNRNCAGKQSESARKMAEKLNRQNQ